MNSSDPVFPALLIHKDGSISGFIDLSCWTHDVDQWFWSDAGDYLIDSRGWRYDQVAERVDSRPTDVPLWAFTQQLGEGCIQQLVATDARSHGKLDIGESDFTSLITPEERIARLVEIACKNNFD